MLSIRKEKIEAAGCEKLVDKWKDGLYSPHECGREVAFRSGENLWLCARCTVFVLQEQLVEAEKKVTDLTHHVGLLATELQNAGAVGTKEPLVTLRYPGD